MIISSTPTFSPVPNPYQWPVHCVILKLVDSSIWNCAIVNIVVLKIKIHFCLLDFVIRCHALKQCGGKNW
jgi:hypothetical protein